MLKHLMPGDVAEICAIAGSRHGLEELARIYLIGLGDPVELLTIERSGELTDALEARIEQLSPEAGEDLTALAWLGRGDEEGAFDALLRYARQTNGHDTPHYLASMWPLGIYLQRGIRQLTGDGASTWVSCGTWDPRADSP